MSQIFGKPMRWGNILTAFGRQQKIEPEKERLALLKDKYPPALDKSLGEINGKARRVEK